MMLRGLCNTHFKFVSMMFLAVEETSDSMKRTAKGTVTAVLHMYITYAVPYPAALGIHICIE